MNAKKVCMFAAACLSAVSLSFAQDAEKQIYQNVMSQLDTPNVALTYRHTQEFLKPFQALMNQCMPLVLQVSGIQAPAAETASNLLATSGLQSVQGFGSSTNKADGVYTVKNYMYAPAAQQKGLIWDAMPANQSLDTILGAVPESAFFVWAADCNFISAYNTLVAAVCAASPEAKAGYDQAIAEAQKQGIDVKKLVESVKGMALYLNCDPGKPQLFPGLTGGAILVKTTNDQLFKTLLTKVNPEDVQDGMIVVPNTPLRAAQIGKYLVLTNDMDSVKKAPAFQNTAKRVVFGFEKDLPKNAVAFFGWKPAFGTLITTFLAVQPLDVKNFVPLFGLDQEFAAVQARTADGMQGILKTRNANLAILAGEISAGMVAQGLAGAVMLDAVLPYLPQIISAQMMKRLAAAQAQQTEQAENDEEVVFIEE